MGGVGRAGERVVRRVWRGEMVVRRVVLWVFWSGVGQS